MFKITFGQFWLPKFLTPPGCNFFFSQHYRLFSVKVSNCDDPTKNIGHVNVVELFILCHVSRTVLPVNENHAKVHFVWFYWAGCNERDS